MTTATSWRMRGHIMGACSCNLVCPCNFGGDPTQLPCEAMFGYQIQEGNYAATQLGGLNFVLYIRIPGKVFDGNWTLGAYLDQRATQEQMEGLGAILSGEAGGLFSVLGGLVGNALPPKQVPISFETVDGEHHISVPGLLEVGSEKISNPMPGQPPLDTKVTDFAVPFYTGTANIRRSSAFSLTDPNLNFQHPGRNCETGHFDYSGP